MDSFCRDVEMWLIITAFDILLVKNYLLCYHLLFRSNVESMDNVVISSILFLHFIIIFKAPLYGLDNNH